MEAMVDAWIPSPPPLRTSATDASTPQSKHKVTGFDLQRPPRGLPSAPSSSLRPTRAPLPPSPRLGFYRGGVIPSPPSGERWQGSSLNVRNRLERAPIHE